MSCDLLEDFCVRVAQLHARHGAGDSVATCDDDGDDGDDLHDTMSTIRCKLDLGFGIDESANIPRLRNERDRLRLRQHFVSAVHEPEAFDYGLKEPLPRCRSWGEVVTVTSLSRKHGYRRPNGIVVLGETSRPRIPAPLQLSPSPSKRVGPHATLSVLFAPRARLSPKVVWGNDLRFGKDEEEEDEEDEEDDNDDSWSSGLSSDEGECAQVGNGCAEEASVVSKKPPDRLVEEEDGRRVWPPEILATPAKAKAAVAVVEDLVRVYEKLDVATNLLGCIPTIYTSSFEFALIAKSVKDDDRAALAAAGLGAPKGRREDVIAAYVRLHELAALAYAHGHFQLVTSLGRLKFTVLSPCLCPKKC